MTLVLYISTISLFICKSIDSLSLIDDGIGQEQSAECELRGEGGLILEDNRRSPPPPPPLSKSVKDVPMTLSCPKTTDVQLLRWELRQAEVEAEFTFTFFEFFPFRCRCTNSELKFGRDSRSNYEGNHQFPTGIWTVSLLEKLEAVLLHIPSELLSWESARDQLIDRGRAARKLASHRL